VAIPAVIGNKKRNQRAHSDFKYKFLKTNVRDRRDKMNTNLKLVKVDSNYCNYLRKFDKRVPYNYGTKEIRPFVGVLLKVNGCMYFAPLSSPKPKHLNMKDTIDFLRLDNGKLGAINFNNMIPVMENNVLEIFVNQKNDNDKNNKYMYLLRDQLFWLNRNRKLLKMANTLYESYLLKTLSKNVIRRCCNFPLLEQKCIEYNSKEVVNN